MARFMQKIPGYRHQIPCCFIPLLESLDESFGEKNVCVGRYLKAKNKGPGTSIDLKFYDPCRKAYVLKAKKENLLQYFFLHLDKEQRPQIDEFLKNYSSEQ